MNYVFIAKTLKTGWLFLFLGELFIEGAGDRFLLSDFPVLAKTDLHGWRADGRACSHNLRSVHGNAGKKITFFNLIIL